MSTQGSMTSAKTLSGSMPSAGRMSASMGVPQIVRGVSPTIEVTEIDGGHRITIADVNGIQSFDVMDGGGSAASARIGEVTIYAESWVGNASPYSQVVAVSGVTENSQVDLTPSVEQLAIFYEKDITFVTENDGGIVTVYAIGQKPTNDYTIQVTITEVEA